MKLSDHSKDELIELAWRASRDELDPEAAKKLFQTNSALPSQGEKAEQFRKEWDKKSKEEVIQDIKIIYLDAPMNIKMNPLMLLPTFSAKKGVDNCWKHDCKNKSTEVIELGVLGDVYCCDEHYDETIKTIDEGNGKSLIEVTYPEEA